MNIEGMLIMIISITLVIGLSGFCVFKILKGDTEHIHGTISPE